MLRLYYAPGSCARASHIALCEADADFELRLVDFANAEQLGANYRAINPKGRVPALETDRGVLTETPAILTFIAQSFPAAGLAPTEDPFAFARLQSFNAYLCATVHVAHAHIRRGERWADDPIAIADMKRKAPEVVADCFRLMENGMFHGPWAMGDHYSIVDPYLFTIGQWLPIHRLDIADYPKLAAHQAEMLKRPAVQVAISAEESGQTS